MMLEARHGGAIGTADMAAISDLRDLGFADPVDASDRRLLALLSAFDLRLQLSRSLDGCTWIAAAVWAPHDGTDGDVFSGTGFRPADAIRSCLGEFAEFQSWLFRPDDAMRHGAGAAGSIDPWSVLGFSDRQRREPDAWAGYDDIPSSETFAGEIDWSAAICLNDGVPKWVPSQLCYGRYAQRARAAPSNWRNDSNGCAAGETAEAAKLAALLELIERDATGIWWYGRCRRPGLDPAGLGQPALHAAIEARLQGGQTVHLLDLTHDLRVPVVVAILFQDEQLQGLGFGCKLSLGAAAVSAYLELCQIELSIALARQRASGEDEQVLRWMKSIPSNSHPYLTPTGSSETASAPESTFEDAVERLRSVGLRTYAIDLQRADVAIPAVRLFVPGLCHFKTRLGHRRLVEVPKKLGWKPEGFGAADLNSIPLLI
jgi:ribosomal protein S12 methylthiotransferase accessory factor